MMKRGVMADTDSSAGECCARAQMESYAAAEAVRFARKPSSVRRFVDCLRELGRRLFMRFE